VANGQLTPLLGFLRRVSAPPEVETASDAHLLERFGTHQDEVAFSLLMQRHGPMVLGVCRRLLSDVHDAEDAFQATFLVLVRKANTLRRPEQLGNWLYGVAYRVALRARCRAARLRAREQRVAEEPAMPPDDDAAWEDLRPVLDEEVQRLPARYRAPFVLCYLEGKTKGQAAQRLRLPEGTVSSRLARARERLRSRLSRRGIVLSAAALAGLLEAHARAAVPPLLSQAVRQAAVLMVMEAVTASGISPQVLTLTKGVIHAMFWSKLRIAIGVALVLSVVGLGTGTWYRVGAAGPPDEPRVQREPQAVPGVFGTNRGITQTTSASPLTPPNSRGSSTGDADPLSRRTQPGEESQPRSPGSIQGEWVAIYEERNGQPQTEVQKQGLKLRIGPNHELAWNSAGRTMHFHYRLARNTTPAQIVLEPVGAPVTMRGIYKRQDHFLLLCINYGSTPNEAPTLQAPTDFSAKGPREILLLFRRTDARATAASAQARLRDENSQLQRAVEQASQEFQALRERIETIKKTRAAEEAAKAAARERANEETARLALENMRLHARLDRLTRELKRLQSEQKKLLQDNKAKQERDDEELE